MDSNSALIGAVILIALLVFSNLIVYAIARGAARPQKRVDWMKAAQDSLRDPFKVEDDSLDELHRRVQELEEKKKDG